MAKRPRAGSGGAVTTTRSAFAGQHVKGPAGWRSQQGPGGRLAPLELPEHPLAEQHRAAKKRKPRTGYSGRTHGGWIVLSGSRKEEGPFSKADALAVLRASRKHMRTASREYTPDTFIAIDRLSYFRNLDEPLAHFVYAPSQTHPPELMLAVNRGVDITHIATRLESDTSYLVAFVEAADAELGGFDIEDGLDMVAARVRVRQLTSDPELVVKVFRYVPSSRGDTPLIEGVWPTSHQAIPCEDVAGTIADELCDYAREERAPLINQRRTNKLLALVRDQLLANRADEIEEALEDLRGAERREARKEMEDELVDEVVEAIEDALVDFDVDEETDEDDFEDKFGDILGAVAETLGLELDADRKGGRKNGRRRTAGGHALTPLLLARGANGLSGHIRRARSNGGVYEALGEAYRELCGAGLIRENGRLTAQGYHAQRRLLTRKRPSIAKTRVALRAAHVEELLGDRARTYAASNGWATRARPNPSGIPLSSPMVWMRDASGEQRPTTLYRPLWRDGEGRVSRPRIPLELPVKASASQFRELSRHVHDRLTTGLVWDKQRQRFEQRPGADFGTYVDPGFGLATEVASRARIRKRAGPRGRAAHSAASAAAEVVAPRRRVAGAARELAPPAASRPPVEDAAPETRTKRAPRVKHHKRRDLRALRERLTDED